MKQMPGTAGYYNKHIYPDLEHTLGLGAYDPPSTAIAWVVELGIVPADARWKMLEIGCGAGRNLKALRLAFLRAKLFGFDGSPKAVQMAREGLPLAGLETGDIHGEWPFKGPFDLVLDITTGIPESATAEALDTYITKMKAALRPGGYAVVDAIGTGDGSSRRFGDGEVVTWKAGGDTKLERLITLEDAQALYERHGFETKQGRIERFAGEAFGVVIEREFVQLLLRKP
jgi:SAM-dependent methyltransferase